jgi:hypothetical protein
VHFSAKWRDEHGTRGFARSLFPSGDDLTEPQLAPPVVFKAYNRVTDPEYAKWNGPAIRNCDRTRAEHREARSHPGKRSQGTASADRRDAGGPVAVTRIGADPDK